MKNNTAKKLFAWMSLLVMLACTAGCAANEAPDAGTFAQAETAYRLKQIYMCGPQKGWAVTTANELLFTVEGPEGFAVVRELEEINAQTDGFLNASFVDERTAYLAYFSSDNVHLAVEYTHDGGASWQQTLLDYGAYGDVCDAGSAYMSFTDADNGYLLYCSTPGAGMMTKLLFKTMDGGKSFSLIKELTSDIAGYPQGISFVGDKGYLAVSYHGQDICLYKTSDGGITWTDAGIFSSSEGNAYADGYAPAFSADDRQKGILVLKVVGDNTVYQLFTTLDGGGHWTQAGNLPCDSVTAYSCVNDKSFLLIDGDGNLFETAS